MAEHHDSVDYAVEFDRRIPLYASLREEVLFVLNDAIGKTPIKTHSVSGRVKDRSSFLDKIERKGYADPFLRMPDLVGVRIVCLFYDDIPKLCDIVRDEFNVLAEENKITEAPDDSFGYMSVHFECALHEHFTGARYDQLKGIVFEVQVRTILQDAWANVSHYLAYKGTASVPADLRKDFNALSALFYIADQQFQSFYDGVLKSEDETAVSSIDGHESPVPIDRATVRKLLRQMFSEREAADPLDVSELAEELVKSGFRDIASIQDAIMSGMARALEAEGQVDEPDFVLSDTGITRFALAMVSDIFFETVYDNGDGFPRVIRND